MKEMNKTEKIIMTILTVLVISALCYSSCCLFVKGILSWHCRQREYQIMIAELGGLFVLFVLIVRLVPFFRIRILSIVAVLAVFLWVHRLLLPVIVSGLYVGYLWKTGWWLRYRIARIEEKKTGREFLTGCLFTVCMFCLMSAFGIGKILYLWRYVLVTTAVIAAGEIWKLRNYLQGKKYLLKSRKKRKEEISGFWKLQKNRHTLGQACIIAAVLAFFCIQAGRMNIAVDFDSLWYGVRSPYILDNGGGIYENMGTIGIVYTYSKGLEVLTLPLSVLPSYSFGISFNLWLAVGILAVSYHIGQIYMEERQARLLVVFLASIPGIMNMTVTAKSDIATLYFQLMLFYEILLYLKGEKQAFWYALASFFFSWTLKPTALVFSTAVLGMTLIYLILTRELFSAFSCRKEAGGAFGALALSFGALTGIWARTFLITGLPVTSVFSSILTRMGFQMKYPFNVQKIPNSGADLPLKEWIKNVGKRIYGVFLIPMGDDMDHVILAWGSLGMFLLACVWAAWLFLDKKKRTEEEKKLDNYLWIVFLPFLACCLVSLALLTQVDGNYFMLLYVLSAVCMFRIIHSIARQKIRKGIFCLTVLVVIFSGHVTSLTNWNWALGFTPISWKHLGYYNHEQEHHQRLSEAGNSKIWDILAEDSKNRLIAIGRHPEALAFPCNAQSYLDITGSWGNVMLVKYMDNFVEFMDYSKTDYVYAEAGYISKEERAWSLTCDLIEYGVLVPVCYEQGNMLAAVDIHGKRTDQSVAFLEEFKKLYRPAKDGKENLKK